MSEGRAMLPNARRKNGKQASCEPCRKGKMRCDHQRPFCIRCQRRGKGPLCWYHPAPLTRSRGPSTIAPLPGLPLLLDTGRGALDGGCIGSADRSVLLPNLSSLESAEDDISEAMMNKDHLQSTYEILGLLKPLKLIQRLVQEYYDVSQATLVPSPFILSAVSALSECLPDLSGSSTGDREAPDESSSRFVEGVLRSSSNKVIITPRLGVSEFFALYNGENLRLETVGLIASIAARSCCLGLSRDDKNRKDFIQAMAQCSERCLCLLRKIGSEVNDLTVWLAFENLRLTANIQDDASPEVWHRLGDLATYVLALDIHREQANSSAPFFLGETRRRTFTRAYQLDKHIATLLNRPPRLSRHYSTCKMPLDLSDAAIFEENSERLEASRQGLTNEGWDSGGQHSSSSWIRLRYLVAVLADQMLECHFCLPASDHNDMLRSLLKQSQDMWVSLPGHLQYTHACWFSGLPAIVCFMLTDTRLSYLHNEFHIHRMLDAGKASYESLQVSADIVATVLRLGDSRDRAVFLRHDFSYVVLSYGLPSAVALARALTSNGQGETSGFLLAGLSRSVTIRNLSVFASHLEVICKPERPDHSRYVHASRLISRALDDVLDSSLPAVAAQQPFTAPPSGLPDPTLAASSSESELPGSNAMDNLDLFNHDDMDMLEPSRWINSIDWGSLGAEWAAF